MEVLVKVGMGLCMAFLLVLFAVIWSDRSRRR